MAQLAFDKAKTAMDRASKRKKPYKKPYMGRLSKGLAEMTLALDKAVRAESLNEKQKEDTLKQRREKRWENESLLNENRQIHYSTGSKPHQQTCQDHSYSQVPVTVRHRTRSVTHICSRSIDPPNNSDTNVASNLMKMFAANVLSQSNPPT
jgi:hypothetical protein